MELQAAEAENRSLPETACIGSMDPFTRVVTNIL
jgi:hypothetical protein